MQDPAEHHHPNERCAETLSYQLQVVNVGEDEKPIRMNCFKEKSCYHHCPGIVEKVCNARYIFTQRPAKIEFYEY